MHQRGPLLIFFFNLWCALAYAIGCTMIRHQKRATGMNRLWPVLGAAAVVIMFIVVLSDGATGPLSAYAYLWLLIFTPIAVAVTAGLTYVLLRIGMPVLVASLICAAAYAGLALIHLRAVAAQPPNPLSTSSP